MPGKPAGWYWDASGEATHEAYRVGHKWTGEARRPSRRRPSGTRPQKMGCLRRLLVIMVGAMALFIVLLIGIVVGDPQSFDGSGSSVETEPADEAPSAAEPSSALSVVAALKADNYCLEPIFSRCDVRS